MIKNEDKGIPLMKPTFFSDDDLDNPKYLAPDTINKNFNADLTYSKKKVKKRNLLTKIKKSF